MTSVAEIYKKDSRMFNVVTAMTMIQNQRPRNRNDTDFKSDASDDETDVPNAWTVDLARYKGEDLMAETENPLTW